MRALRQRIHVVRRHVNEGGTAEWNSPFAYAKGFSISLSDSGGCPDSLEET